MATVVNDRDVLIMAAVPRFAAPTDRGFFVNPEQAIFKVTNGVASPSSFSFTPTLLNVTGTVSYVPSAGLSISVSGNNCSLDYSNMTAAAGTVTATLVFDGVTYTRTINVSKVVDGIAPKILDLAASSQVFKVDKAGAGSPGSIELVAYGQNLTGTPNFTILAGTATLTIGSDNTRKQLTFANMSSDLVTVQVAQDGQTDTMTFVKVREGADGANAVTGFLTNEAQTVPAELNGNVISMAGASSAMKVYVGIVDDSANWSFTASPASSASGLTYALTAAGVMTASALSASVDSAFVDITAARQGYSSVTKRFSIAKSKTGPQGVVGDQGVRGNVNLSVITSGSVWSDAEANAAVVSMTGTAARSRDVVNLYRADKTWAQKRIFDGFNWSILVDAFDGSIFVKGTVLAEAIDSRGLSIRDLQGNILLGVNTPLAASMAAPGTLNSDLTPSITAAQMTADTAKNAIANIVADNILSRSEKSSAIAEFAVINGEKNGIAQQATDLGVSNTNFVTNYTSLINYLNALSPTWNDTSTDTTIDGPTFRANFLNYYNERQALLNSIAAKIQSNAATAQGTATNARAAADSAAGTANAAQIAAGVANTAIANISADNILSKGEKSAVIAEWNQISAELTGIVNQAQALGVTTTNLTANYTALTNYLNGLSPAWNDTGTDTAIDPGTFRANFLNYYNERQIALNGTAAAAATRATWALTANKPADTDILNSYVKTAPNLVERLSQWTMASAGAAIYTNTAAGYAINGESILLDGSGNTPIAFSRALVLQAGTDYTLSFKARAANGAVLSVDLGNAAVSTSQFTLTVTNTLYVLHWNSSSGLMSNVNLRFFSTHPAGQIVVSDVKLEQSLTNSGWSDNVITLGNSTTFIAPNAIGNTQIGGDLFSTNWNGYTDTRGTGWYLQRGGTFYGYNVVLRGAVMSANMTAPGTWPAAGGGNVMYFGPEGVQVGNFNDGSFIYMAANGNMQAPGFALINKQLTLTSPVIITPRVQTTFAISIPGISVRSQVNTSSYQSFGTMSASMANGVGPFRYLWTLSVDGGDVKMVGDPTASTVQIQARGTNSFCNAYLNLTVTDSNGAQAASGSNISIQFGSGVQQ